MADTDPTSLALEHRSFPELARAIRSQLEPLLDRWEQLGRKLIPEADRLTHAELRDHFPVAIQRMADALEADHPFSELESAARLHTITRAEQSFCIGDVVKEYRILRQVLVEGIHASLGRRMYDEEFIAIDHVIDSALSVAVTNFAVHQQRLLNRANEAESQFLSFLSHDLRNQLNYVILSIDALGVRLAARPDCADELADVTAARVAILETLEGMEQVLQAERLRKGKVQARNAPVNLSEALTHIAAPFMRTAREKRLQVEFHVPRGLVVETDRQLLALVIQNLINNAVKYSSRGTITITAERADGRFSVSVSDQGPGIAPEKVERLFDAFVRGDTHGQAGMGLGLAIASRAAKVLGGTLSVSSQVGHGATFKLTVDPTAANSPEKNAASSR